MDLSAWMDVFSAGVNSAPFVKTKTRSGEEVCSKVGRRNFKNLLKLDRTGTQTLTFTNFALFLLATSQRTASKECSEAPLSRTKFSEVVLQKSMPTQIRELILYYYQYYRIG